MMNNVLEEYLVSLGFSVDTNSLNHAKAAMQSAEGFMEKFAGKSVASFAAAGAAVVGFVATANVALGKFVTQLAQNDLEMDKWARSMYTTKENAMSLNNSIKAMGVSMEDLYLSPELLANFNKLRSQSFQLMPPGEYQEQMKFIRSIMFEFQRFKLEVTYALQWVGHYLVKYLQGPLGNIKITFKAFNDYLTQTMPIWTKKIAEFLLIFVKLGVAAKTAGEFLFKLFKELPKSLVVAGGALTGFFALMKMGPIGWLIAGLTAILLLIDDYTGAMHGKKSAFGDFWKSMNSNGTFSQMKNSFNEITESINDVVKALGEVYNFFVGGHESDVISGALSGINTILQNIATALETIVSPMKTISKYFENLTSDIYDFNEAGGFSALQEKMSDRPGLGKAPADAKILWDELMKFMGMRNNSAYAMPQAFMGGGSTSASQINNFNIYGGGDPAGVATAVSKQIPTEIMIRNNGRVIL